MTVYLRVHPDPMNYDVFDAESELYDTRLNEVEPEELLGYDVIFRMTPAQFSQLRDRTIDGMFFRIFYDKSDTNPANGSFYDAKYHQVDYTDIPASGTFLIIPATADEFSTFEKLREA